MGPLPLQETHSRGPASVAAASRRGSAPPSLLRDARRPPPRLPSLPARKKRQDAQPPHRSGPGPGRQVPVSLRCLNQCNHSIPTTTTTTSLFILCATGYRCGTSFVSLCFNNNNNSSSSYSLSFSPSLSSVKQQFSDNNTFECCCR